MGTQNLGKGAKKKLSVEKKATIVTYRIAGMQIKDIIAHADCSVMTVTCFLAASRAL
jgi:hypothetical protein